MKSQDLIEDSSKIPKGRKINRDFHFIRLFFSIKTKRLPVAVIFCFIGLLKWLKARKEVYFNSNSELSIFITYRKISMIYT